MLAVEVAAGGTVVLTVPGIAYSDAGLRLDPPVAPQYPAVSILGSQCQQVTLQTAVLGSAVESEGHAGVAHIEVAVDEVALQVVEPSQTQRVFVDGLTVLVACLVAMHRLLEVHEFSHMGCHQQVTPLLVFRLVDVPGVQSEIGTYRPSRVDLDVHADIGCQRGVVKQVVADSHLLCPGSNDCPNE